ncbi:pirin [Pseudoalteromonas sp. Bsw20308]|uniref:pirin family protein n=1 Tax=Pseudoalteromonas sp. Bsw20308 TaxID=283699 RepID=UPI0002AAD041|nr:pirin family protein [Pseudoalteromonas sp. Bsw20308]ALQ09249.1 pirin [Pseudoalteromonas sp. Bsw20308]
MKISKVLTAYATQDGDGVSISRIPGFDGKYLDPFLMIDELKSDDKKDYMGGFPEHPHRGIETFTYILKGGFEHRDQMGNKKAIKAGDVQWMSTGRGVMHSEMPLADTVDGLHGFQIWINMPSLDKMRDPRYQDTTQNSAPSFINTHGVTLKALAGSWQFESETLTSSLQGLAANALLADITLPAGKSVHLEPLSQQKVMIYIHSGSIITSDDQTIPAGKLLILEPDSNINITSEQGAGVLVLAGDPLNQPIAHMGPFVMTTQAEVQQAVRDYQNGEFGKI